MITVLVQIEGVLADARQPSLVDNSPLQEGLLLFRSLQTNALAIIYTTHDEERARYWLQRERIETPLKLIKLDSAVEDMIVKCRAAGHDLTLMLTADPDHVVAAYKQGLQSLLFVHPSYGRPEWRPDYEDTIRPWNEMVTEIIDKRLTLASDGRTDHE